MFIRESRRWYNQRDGQQHAWGPFLMLFSGTEKYSDGKTTKLYAAVRSVTLDQCGHWMMGTATLAGYPVTVSGTYGDDGLPMAYDELKDHAAQGAVHEVPFELAQVFWSGGGHNESGAEGPAMAAWALENERKLRRRA